MNVASINVFRVSVPDTPLVEYRMRLGVLRHVYGKRKGGGGLNSIPGGRGRSSEILLRVP